MYAWLLAPPCGSGPGQIRLEGQATSKFSVLTAHLSTDMVILERRGPLLLWQGPRFRHLRLVNEVSGKALALGSAKLPLELGPCVESLGRFPWAVLPSDDPRGSNRNCYPTATWLWTLLLSTHGESTICLFCLKGEALSPKPEPDLSAHTPHRQPNELLRDVYWDSQS